MQVDKQKAHIALIRIERTEILSRQKLLEDVCTGNQAAFSQITEKSLATSMSQPNSPAAKSSDNPSPAGQ